MRKILVKSYDSKLLFTEMLEEEDDYDVENNILTITKGVNIVFCASLLSCFFVLEEWDEQFVRQLQEKESIK